MRKVFQTLSKIWFLPFLMIPFYVLGQELTDEQRFEINKEIKEPLFPGTSGTDSIYIFEGLFEYKMIQINDSITLNSLLFHSKHRKGLIFYLHGSIGDLGTWGKIASFYTDLNYDFYVVDYRGYGKSKGHFINEQQWYSDMQIVYDSLKRDFDEQQIVIMGQSLGTAAASYLSAHNNPQLLILQAPYYSMLEWMRSFDSSMKAENLDLQLENYAYIQDTKAPVMIFHGDNDKAISLESSLKLKSHFKPSDRFVVLKGEGHNNFINNRQYKEELEKTLNNLKH